MSFFTKKEWKTLVIGMLIGLCIFLLLGYALIKGLSWIADPPELF